MSILPKLMHSKNYCLTKLINYCYPANINIAIFLLVQKDGITNSTSSTLLRDARRIVKCNRRINIIGLTYFTYLSVQQGMIHDIPWKNLAQ